MRDFFWRMLRQNNYLPAKLALVIASGAVAVTVASAQQTAQPPPTVPAVAPQVRESMISFTHGMMHLSKDQTDQAIAKFKEAIRLKPTDPNYRYQLAMAYDKQQKWPNKWFQLRQAVLLGPSLDPALQAFQDMLQVAIDQNLLDVGTSTEAVKKGLGEADLVNQEGAVTSWQYGYVSVSFKNQRLASVIDLRGIESYRPADKIVNIDIDENQSWTLKRYQVSAASEKREFQGDNPPAADESGFLTIERLLNVRLRSNARELMTSMRSSLSRQFPDLQWQVLHGGEQNGEDDDLLIEWQLTATTGPAQHEMVRLISSGPDIYRLSYTATTIGDKKTWIERLSSASLEPATAAN